MLKNSNGINAKILLIPLSIIISFSNINAMNQINKADIFNNINNNSVETNVNSEINIIDGETNISSINNNIHNNINNIIPNINNINNTDLNLNNNIIENKINTISSVKNNNADNNFKINTDNTEIENNIVPVYNNISNNNIATSINDINTSTINTNNNKNKIIGNNIISKKNNTLIKESDINFDYAKDILKSIGEGNNNPLQKQKAVQFIKSLANRIDNKLKTNNNEGFKKLLMTNEILATNIKQYFDYKILNRNDTIKSLKVVENTNKFSTNLTQMINQYIANKDGKDNYIKELFSHFDINKVKNFDDISSIDKLKSYITGPVDTFANCINYYNFTEDIMDPNATDNQSRVYYSNIIDFIVNCYYNKEINKSEYQSILQYMLYNNTTQLVNIMFNYYSQKHDAYSYEGISEFINWFCLQQINDNNIRCKHDNVMSCMQKIIECLAEFEFREIQLKPLELNGDCKINKKSYELFENKVYSEVFKKIILPAFHYQLIDETAFFSTMFKIDTRQAITAYLVNDTNLQCKMSKKFNLLNICKNTLTPRINYLNNELKRLTEPGINQDKQKTNKLKYKINSQYIAKSILDYIPLKLVANFRNPNFKSK